MRRIAILIAVLLIFCASSYAADVSAPRSVLLAETQAADVRAVMYMTSW